MAANQRSRHTPCAGMPAHGVCGLHSKRSGITLLELILALGLSVVLLFSVGMALRLYWKSFDVKRTNVEQAHLARAIMRRMEDDIRAAVQFTPVDLSGLEAMTSTANIASTLSSVTGGGASGGGGGGGAPSGAGGGASGGSPMGGTDGGSPATQQPANQSGQGSGGSAPMGGATSGASTKGGSSASPTVGSPTASSPSGTASTGTGEATEEESTAAAQPAVVGLYGSAYELQFDVSRLPRLDEYAGGSPTSMVQIPSDIKTVTYYVRSESSTGGGQAMGGSAPAGSMEPSADGQGRGLVRMEMDRAVSAFSESSGLASSGSDNARVLAEEVTSITFRYWNGTEWAADWNSDDMGGLPLAIEIVMTMADPNAVVPIGPPVQSFGAPEATTTDTSYRIVVNLPSASLPPPAEEPATEGEAATPDSEAAATSGQSGNSGSGSPTAGSGATSGSSGASGSQTGAKK